MFRSVDQTVFANYLQSFMRAIASVVCPFRSACLASLYTLVMVHNILAVSYRWKMSLPRADFKMVLGESLGEGDGEIPQNFGSVRLVGGESLVAHRTLFSQDSK